MCFSGLTRAQHRAFGVDRHCIMFGVIYTHLLYMFSKRIRGTLFSADIYGDDLLSDREIHSTLQ
jgi:hypothetical protein